MSGRASSRRPLVACTRPLYRSKPVKAFGWLLSAAFGWLSIGCSDRVLCAPNESSFGFFSKGDCILADATYFQGHEWLTCFGNQDLDSSQRFTDSEIHQIAEGNRRVDWPKELLVHMNTSALDYIQALTRHTDRPEHQRFHFLLDDRNTSRQAADDSLAHLRRVSVEALELWVDNRSRALALIGQGNHLIQDSFSAAHAVRDEEHDWCVVELKAYIPRARGFRDPNIKFHGGHDDETVGHTTHQDSIYRKGRDCRDPGKAAGVERCLNAQARRARTATRDYLEVMQHQIARAVQEGPDYEAEASVNEALDDYVDQHFGFCE